MLLVVEGWKIVQRVIAGRGMEDCVASRAVEDSVAVNIALAKRLLWCAIKGNRVSAVYINGRVCTLPLPIRE